MEFHSKQYHPSVNSVAATKGQPFFQPRLTINNPDNYRDDQYEQEADAVADKVMRMDTPSLQKKTDTDPFFSPSPVSINPVQKKCAHCEEEEEKKMQRKEIDGEETTADNSLENYVGALSGGGQPLPNEVRNFYEPRIGYDFSNVKVHTDDVAAKSAQSINALAYTTGDNIVFNDGQYSPNTDTGKKLLGHELTHVVQQNSLLSKKPIQRSCGTDAIGEPTGCEGSSIEDIPMRPRYLFEQNCDEFLTGNETDLRADALTYMDGELIEIHGLASEEGSVGFNVNLSCARALRAMEIIEEVTAAKGIIVILRVYSHGPQIGDRPVNRSVAIVRNEIIPEPETEEPENTEPPQCSGIYSDGRDFTADGDHDLDKDHHDGEWSPDIYVYDYGLGETLAWTDYYAGFFAGTAGETTNDDDRLYNHFMTGDGSRLNFGTSTDMSAIISREENFANLTDAFEQDIRTYFTLHHTLCGYDGDTFMAANRLGYLNDQFFVWAVMGGHAGVEARVTTNTAGGLDVTYKIFDHYGAGVSDAWSALPGLSALYYLQHFHGAWGASYTPYIWSVEINRTIF